MSISSSVDRRLPIGNPCGMLRGPVRPFRYPLKPLAELRARQLDDAVRALAVAMRARQDAEEARLRAEDELAKHGVTEATVRDAEGAALDRGDLRVADLSRADAWAIRMGSERRSLAEAATRVRAAESQAQESETGAKSRVGGRRADAEVVLRDRGRWEAALREQTEAREEEASFEAWRPKV